MINAINIALSGLDAAGKRAAAASSNVANATTAGSLEEGKTAPYQALTTQRSTQTDGRGNGLGVQTDIIPSGKPFIPAYAPDSPFANKDGIIGIPNINLAEEAIHLKLATLEFKANASVIRSVSETSDEFFRILDKKA